jgi:hypothetical protein
MKSLGFIPLGVVLLACGLAAQGKAVPPFLIAVHDGIVNVETPGLPAVKISMKAGDFDWHSGPLTHTIINTGPARFEAVEAVWK